MLFRSGGGPPPGGFGFGPQHLVGPPAFAPPPVGFGGPPPGPFRAQCSITFILIYLDKLLHSSSTISPRRHATPRSHGSTSWRSTSIPSRLHASPWWYVLELSPPNCPSLIITQVCRHSLPMVPPVRLAVSLPSLPVVTLDLPRLEVDLHRLGRLAQVVGLRVILALAACILIEFG